MIEVVSIWTLCFYDGREQALLKFSESAVNDIGTDIL